MGKKGTFNALLSLLGYIVRTPILPSHSLEPTLKSSPSSLSLIRAPFCPCRARAAGSWWWSGSTISPAKWSSPRAGMPLSGRPLSWLLCATSMSVFSCSLPQVDWPASPAMEGRYSDAHQHQLHVDTYAFALSYSFHVLTSDRALFSLSFWLRVEDIFLRYLDQVDILQGGYISVLISIPSTTSISDDLMRRSVFSLTNHLLLLPLSLQVQWRARGKNAYYIQKALWSILDR